MPAASPTAYWKGFVTAATPRRCDDEEALTSHWEEPREMVLRASIWRRDFLGGRVFRRGVCIMFRLVMMMVVGSCRGENGFGSE